MRARAITSTWARTWDNNSGNKSATADMVFTKMSDVLWAAAGHSPLCPHSMRRRASRELSSPSAKRARVDPSPSPDLPREIWEGEVLARLHQPRDLARAIIAWPTLGRDAEKIHATMLSRLIDKQFRSPLSGRPLRYVAHARRVAATLLPLHPPEVRQLQWVYSALCLLVRSDL